MVGEGRAIKQAMDTYHKLPITDHLQVLRFSALGRGIYPTAVDNLLAD